MGGQVKVTMEVQLMGHLTQFWESAVVGRGHNIKGEVQMRNKSEPSKKKKEQGTEFQGHR